MRHLKDGRKLSRTATHRRALLKNLATALFEHERIETTLAKAKEARRVAERLITYAKRGDLHSRRLVARSVRNPDVVRKLFDTIAPWYATRAGGYTRVLRTRSRLGDAGEMAVLELVKSAEQKAADRKAREEAAKVKAAAKERKRETERGAEKEAAREAKREEKEGKEPKEAKTAKESKRAKEPKESRKAPKKEATRESKREPRKLLRRAPRKEGGK